MPDWYLDGPSEGGYTDEFARSVFLGKLLYFYDGRNAWHGSWSSTYFNRYSFHPDMEEVEQRVETNRTRGSKWSIVELPTLVVAGKSHAVAAVEINTNKPFSSLSLESLKAPTLTGFAELLRPPERDSLWSFFTTAGRIERAQLPYVKYVSYSIGGNYTLGWSRAKEEKYDLNGAASLIDAAKRHLRQIARQTRPKAIKN